MAKGVPVSGRQLADLLFQLLVGVDALEVVHGILLVKGQQLIASGVALFGELNLLIFNVLRSLLFDFLKSCNELLHGVAMGQVRLEHPNIFVEGFLNIFLVGIFDWRGYEDILLLIFGTWVNDDIHVFILDW